MSARTVAFAVLLLVSSTAAAQRGSLPFSGNNGVGVGLGYQYGFGGQFANPSGFKLFFDYDHRITDIVWLDFQLNPVFGYAAAFEGVCYDPKGHAFACNSNLYYGGWAVEFAGGIKLRFPTPIPLVVDVPITASVMAMFNRQCGDDGAAVMLRAGGEVRYFVTKWLGVGGGVHLAFGPGFHGAGPCSPGYTDFVGLFDFQAGVEFIF
jgi:hypothetical protein